MQLPPPPSTPPLLLGAAFAAEGPLAAERPASVAEIKLICAGKFMDNNVALGSESARRLLVLLPGILPEGRPRLQPVRECPPAPACCH